MYTFTATLEASNGSTAQRIINVSVAERTYGSWEKGELSSNNPELWYKYDGYQSSTYYINYFEDETNKNTNMAEVKISVYEPDGTSITTDTNGTPTSAISPSNSDGIFFFRFEAESSDDRGGFYFEVDTDNTPEVDAGNITFNGGNSSSINTAGDIDVWFYDLKNTGYEEIQWEDSDSSYNADSGATYDADVVVTAFEGTDDLLFYSNDRCDSDDEETHYISSYNDIYIIVEGQYSNTTGSYYVDIDDH